MQQPTVAQVVTFASQFQSSPGQKAGCNPAAELPWAPALGLFQSSPGQKAGCNRAGQTHPLRGLSVSILTRPEGRVQLALALLLGRQCLVSILTRPEGRVQQSHAESCPPQYRVSILTRPEGRVQPP